MFQKMIRHILLLFIICNAAPATAQDNASLETIWETVLKNYPGIKTRDAQIRTKHIDSIFLMIRYLPKEQPQYQHSYG